MTAIQDKVRSLLVPLHNETLLIPNIAIAELIPYQPLGPVEDAPDWLMGILSWRGYELPVISFESWRGQGRSEPADDMHIAVMNSIKGDKGVPFYALATRGIPRLLRLAEEDLAAPEAEGAGAVSGVLAQVRVNAEDALIPDLDALESLAASHAA